MRWNNPQEGEAWIGSLGFWLHGSCSWIELSENQTHRLRQKDADGGNWDRRRREGDRKGWWEVNRPGDKVRVGRPPQAERRAGTIRRSNSGCGNQGKQGAPSSTSSFPYFLSYGLISMHRKVLLWISVFVFPLSNSSIQGKIILGGKEVTIYLFKMWANF